MTDVYRLLYGELGASKHELQEAIWHGGDGLEPVLDRAVAVVIEAGKPEYASDPLRPCVHEDLLLVYQMVDSAWAMPRSSSRSPPGSRASSTAVHSATSAWRCCMSSASTARAGSTTPSAWRWATSPSFLIDEAWSPSRRLDLMCARADIAAARGDGVALREIVEAIRPQAARIEAGNHTLRARGRVRRAPARDRRGSTTAPRRSHLAAAIAELQPSADFVLAARTYQATYLAAKRRWRDALAVAAPGIDAARTRQAYRWHAELLVIALEAHDQLDEDPVRRTEHARELAGVLVRLKSRDLDGRASAAGVRAASR